MSSTKITLLRRYILRSDVARRATASLSVFLAVAVPFGATYAQNVARPSVVQTAAPDMSAYDCIGAASAPSRRNMHIAQVIKGTYYEWNEILVGASGTPGMRVACISLLKPDARSLDAASAATFLNQSAAIGAPNAAANATNGARERDATPSSPRPQDVAPEPLKRAIRPRDNGVARPAANPALAAPPTPAEHRRSDDNAVSPPASVQKPPATVPQTTGPQAGPSDASTLTIVQPPTTTMDVGSGPQPPVNVTGAGINLQPFSTIGYLVVTYPNGQSFRCTGFLVSPYVVLTAGHCIQNNNRGGWVTSVQFYPGLYQDVVGGPVQQPYPMNSDFANLKATQEWTQISGPDSFEVTQYRYDFAAIQFNTPFTFTSTFTPVVFDDPGQDVTTAGYPATLAGVAGTVQGLYESTNQETSESLNVLRQSDVREFAVPSSGGDSGSPFWGGALPIVPPYFVGSLSYGDDTGTISGGPWYDSWNRDLLTSWMTWTPGNATSPSPSAGIPALAVATAASYGNSAAQSYLRFYNAGTSAGTVTVMLASGTTGQDLFTWTSPTIAAGAAPQFGMVDIESLIPASLRTGGYALAIQPTFNGYFQHVTWNPGAGVIDDLSTCNTGTTTDPQVLMNVHSSRVGGGYPSYIIIHNTATTPASTAVTLGIYNAYDGSRLGGYSTPSIPANGLLAIAMSTIESVAGISPPPNMFYYVVKIESGFTGYLQHLVNNTSIGVVTDMTAVCTLASS